MKNLNLSLLLLSALLFTMLFTSGCAPSVVKIGTLNMVSHRNVDPDLKYELVSSYAGGSKKELKKSRATTVEEALEQTVRKVPGGELMMNVKLYQISGKYFAIEGDVWGKKDNQQYRGFALGDRVVCRDRSIIRNLDLKRDIIYGEVTGMIDDKEVYVRLEDIDRIVKIPYDKIVKSKR